LTCWSFRWYNIRRRSIQKWEAILANIDALADATIRRKEKLAKHVGWPLAAIKAIEGVGIRHKPDVNNLKRKVLAKLRERGVIRPRQRTA